MQNFVQNQLEETQTQTDFSSVLWDNTLDPRDLSIQQCFTIIFMQNPFCWLHFSLRHSHNNGGWSGSLFPSFSFYETFDTSISEILLRFYIRWHSFSFQYHFFQYDSAGDNLMSFHSWHMIDLWIEAAWTYFKGPSLVLRDRPKLTGYPGRVLGN